MLCVIPALLWKKGNRERRITWKSQTSQPRVSSIVGERGEPMKKQQLWGPPQAFQGGDRTSLEQLLLLTLSCDHWWLLLEGLRGCSRCQVAWKTETSQSMAFSKEHFLAWQLRTVASPGNLLDIQSSTEAWPIQDLCFRNPNRDAFGALKCWVCDCHCKSYEK